MSYVNIKEFSKAVKHLVSLEQVITTTSGQDTVHHQPEPVLAQQPNPNPPSQQQQQQPPPPPPPPPPDVPVFGTINQGPQFKVAVLIPTNLWVDVRWTIALQAIFADLPPGSTYMMDYRYGLGETREALVTQALKTIPDLTHILFVDSDVIPTIPNPVRVLLSDDKPMVSAVYFNSLFTGVAAWRGEAAIPIKDQPSHLQECDKTGAGFLLIKKEVFDILEKNNEPRPWFYYTVDGGQLKMQSEDFYFMDKCRKYGIKPWVDLRCTCGHVKTVVINADGTIAGPPPHQTQQPTAQGAPTK